MGGIEGLNAHVCVGNQAFEKAKSLGKAPDGLTADEVVQQIMDSYPRSEDELGGRASLKEFVMYAGSGGGF